LVSHSVTQSINHQSIAFFDHLNLRHTLRMINVDVKAIQLQLVYWLLLTFVQVLFPKLFFCLLYINLNGNFNVKLMLMLILMLS